MSNLASVSNSTLLRGLYFDESQVDNTYEPQFGGAFGSYSDNRSFRNVVLLDDFSSSNSWIKAAEVASLTKEIVPSQFYEYISKNCLEHLGLMSVLEFIKKTNLSVVFSFTEDNGLNMFIETTDDNYESVQKEIDDLLDSEHVDQNLLLHFYILI